MYASSYKVRPMTSYELVGLTYSDRCIARAAWLTIGVRTKYDNLPISEAPLFTGSRDSALISLFLSDIVCSDKMRYNAPDLDLYIGNSNSHS